MKKILLCIAALGFIATTNAQDIDPLKLTQETQQLRQDKSKLDLVWWIPNEFWEYSFKKNPVITPEQQKEFIAVVDKYTIFCIMEGSIGVFGGITGTPKDELQTKVSLAILDTKLKPLSDSELSPDAQNFLQMMKPMFSSMLGQMGQSMEFIVFNGKHDGGEKYLNPKFNGSFVLNLGEKQFSWRLPLASLLPPRFDADTNEEFPGNYIYNPFTGKKLITK
jgi:hypothetical protein